MKGDGELVAYSSARPRLYKVNDEEAKFTYKFGHRYYDRIKTSLFC